MIYKKMTKIMKSFYRKIQLQKRLLSQTNITYEEALQNIKDLKFKESPEFIQVNEMSSLYDLMIIIPVYNTEKYLEECLQSVVAQQTQYSFGIVIINDGSTDNSEEILERYIDKENIKVIHQHNQGLSGARNSGLKQICGQYVMFLDSDDILPPNAIQALMDVGKKYNADVVAGGYDDFSEKGIIKRNILSKDIQMISAEDIPGFACMKIFRAKLLEEFCFPEGYLFEDTVISKLIYPKCKKAYVIPDIIYMYRNRADSISHTYNINNIDTFWITKYCLEESIKRGYSLDCYTYKEYLKQAYINYLRTRYLPENIQESLFILTAEMLDKYWKNVKVKSPIKMKWLDQAIKQRSFLAYSYVLERWELI